MSLFAPGPSRMPSGFLYEWPYEIPQSMPLAGDWNYRFSTEVGAVAGHASRNAARLRDYRDYRDGAVLNYLNLALERPGTAHYLDFTAGAVGRDDQHYRATVGRYGDFKANLYFSQIPRAFTDQARTVFQGAGTANLTLLPGLVPGNNSPAQIAAALESARPFALGFIRKNAGLDFDATPGAEWRIYAGYHQDRKKGARPFGGAASFPGIPTVETIEPIDYRTHNLLAGVQWTGDTLQMNLGYTGSFFRNGVGTLTWENPLAVDFFDAAVLQRGRMDLYPDNAFHHLKLDASAALPLRGRLSGSLAWSRMTQDDDLIPPTVNSGVLSGGPGINLANWNTADALGTKSANARIDTRLAHLNASFSPLQDLSLQARVRRYEEDNKTRYTAFNPLTGQFGYLGTDGAINNIVPGYSRVQIRSVPFEYRKDNYGVEGDYRLLRRTNLVLGYEREDIKGQQREYRETAEDRVRVAINNRDIPWATMRLSYENARRAGDNYAFDPNRLFYSAVSLSRAPATLAELRKHDIADRRQQIVNGRVNFLLAKDMDLAVSGRYLDNDYGAQYGRLGERVYIFNLEWSWLPSPRASAYAHYGFERVRSRMALISDDPAGLSTGNPNAGGAVYPLANRWDEESRDDAHIVGLGFRYAFNHAAVLESGYTYLYSPYRTRYSFASPGAIVGGAAVAATAGDGMPDILFRQQALETSLKLALNKNTVLRLYHRYERATFKDWHYDGLPLVLADGAAVFLGAGPQSYRAHVIGVFFQYTPGRPERTGR
ncbi:MAG: MtrB/PioB family decaheme-associated outer membrane protein [Betaproteobacteria bacterium]|nr:MtrB/PioB family decaheme-associated outer membrane protein [Betaproteobacteria bacterium]